jgi:hypothetical protein
MRSIRFLLTVALVVGAGLVLAADCRLSADDAQAGTDFWRRTAHGWERIDHVRADLAQYRTPDNFFVTDELTRPPATRWDVHPACLVALQVLLVAAAFGYCGFSLKQQTGQN